MLGAKDAVEIIIFRFDINEPAKIAEIMEEYEDARLSPPAATERGYIDKVVNPARDSQALIPRCPLCGATRKPENR